MGKTFPLQIFGLAKLREQLDKEVMQKQMQRNTDIFCMGSLAAAQRGVSNCTEKMMLARDECWAEEKE